MRFLATGLMVNGLLYGAFAILLYLGMDYRVAATGIYIVGVVWGFIQNRNWSWQSNRPLFRSLITYLLVYIAIGLVHVGFMTLQVEGFGFHPLAASLISVAVLLIPIFMLLDRFVFMRA